MSRSPGVSTVIPTYNRADLVCEAIESVLVQQWGPLEVVVVDDASTDDTSRRLAALSARDARVRVLRREVNGGESVARNDGIRAARFEYVALLDSDNRFEPDKLELQMPALLVDPRPSVSFTGYRLTTTTSTRDVLLDGWSSASDQVLERLLEGCCVNTSTVVARRSSLIESGLFRPALICCADHDAWLRLAVLGHSFIYERRTLTDYRLHEGSVSGDEALVAEFSERVINDTLHRADLPQHIAQRRSSYEARWALNSAVRYVAARNGRAGLAALMRALRRRPLSARPGWLGLAVQCVRVAWPPGRETR